MTVQLEAHDVIEARLKGWHLFLETQAALLYQLEKELQTECGIPLTWYGLLLRLSEAPEQRLRMQELVGPLMLTKSGVTRLVDRIEAAGLIARSTCPSDRRGAFASLTEAGRVTLERAGPTHRRGIQQHFGRHLSDAELASLTSILAKIKANTPARGAGLACLPRPCDE